MDDQQTPNNPPEQPFTRKTVETPILESSLRQQISTKPAGGGFKAFYVANKIYFWAIIVGALIIGVLAYLAFKSSPAPKVTEADVAITVDVPPTVPSGGEAVYKITVQNNDKQKLVDMELELAYPDGIAYQSSIPKASNLSGSLFPIKPLIYNQNAVVFVKTRVTGNVSDQKTLNIKLHYKYDNFNSEFVKQQTSTVSLVASDVVVELEGPSNTNNAQLVVYTLKYQNNSGADIKSARIKMRYADGFVFASAAPLPSLGSDTWDLGALAKDAGGSIQIQGNFNSTSPGESKTAIAEFLILGNDGQFFTQNSSSFTTAISSLPLLVFQELSQENSSGVIKPGDELSFTLRYQNNASIVANGVNIVVSLDSKVVDMSSLRAEGGLINNNSITWNAASISQLERLAPNESGQLSFSLQVNNPATKDSSKNLNLVSNIKIKSNEYDSYFPGNQLTLKVSSPATLASTLSFVSGQLPPKVGLPTTYKVRFSLTNSSNDFNSGLLTAFIPLDASSFVTSSVSPAEKNNVQFDPSTGKLTWKVGSLPAYAGRFGAARTMDFQMVLNPSSSQVDQSPVLVKTINFIAKDMFTSQDISLSAEDIQTDNLAGEDGYGKGTVQP